MIKQMSISETRKRITSLESDMGYEDTISVNNHGKQILAILRWETYESIAETLEILADPESYSDLKIGIEQMEKNQLVDFEEFKKALNV